MLPYDPWWANSEAYRLEFRIFVKRVPGLAALVSSTKLLELKHQNMNLSV